MSTSPPHADAVSLSRGPLMRRRRRVSRSTVLWGILSFALFQVALTAAIEYRYPQIRDPDYGCRINRLQGRTADVPDAFKLVVLGSSRPQVGLRAALLEAPVAAAVGRPTVAMNFAQPGASSVAELATLKRLLADGVRPDFLLIEVLPPLLCGQLKFHEADELRMPLNRLRSTDLAIVEKYGNPPRETVRLDWTMGSLIPWHTHRLTLLSWLSPRLLPASMHTNIHDAEKIDESGCIPLYTEVVPEELRAKALQSARTEYASYLTGFELGGPNDIALRELLELCRTENLRTVLLLMPEGPEFRTWYSADARSRIDQRLAELSREFQLPIINAREWMPEDQFLDSHHLMAAGARTFSERLGREAIAGLLHEPAPSAAPLPAGDIARREANAHN